MLVTSIFSFSLNVFEKDFFYRVFKSRDCVVKSWTFPKQALLFKCLKYGSVENTMEIGEIARNELFLLSQMCFLLFWRILQHFHET